MPEPGPLRANALTYYGNILAAARAHATTAEVWDAIRSEAASRGYAFPSDIFTQVNAMRANAGATVRASEAFARAPDDAAVGPAFISTPIWARPAAAQEARPAFHVRFEMTTVSAQGEASGWYNMQVGSLEGWSKGMLTDDLAAYGEALTEGYNVAFGGIGAIDIMAV